MTVALVTGASRGLGRALAERLAERGWSLVVDGRRPGVLEHSARALRAHLAPGAALTAVAGDVTDAGHRRALVAAAGALGGLDLVVNNASTLGTTPLPGLQDYALDALRRVLEVNVVAPLALVQEARPLLERSAGAAVLNVTSDASVEAYPGWGGYGLSKAALDHMSAVLAAELPTVAVWAVDPGDMRTDMHRAAFPGEDLSDRPLPEKVAPSVVRLLERRPPSGRYRAADFDAPDDPGAGADLAVATP